MADRQQTIRFVNTRDGVRLAWATSGAGPTLVKASNWISHLEYDWESPMWRHWTQFFSEHFRYLRFDERGNGLSQQTLDELTADHWLADLEDVLAAAKPDKPFVLLGISQGSIAAIQYAVAHPEDVSHLVLYGGYANGWNVRTSDDVRRHMRAIIDLTELGWGKSEPTYRRMYTSRFLPRGTEEQLHWFDELLRKTTTPKMAARQVENRGKADVEDLLAKITVPTLILHCREDQCIPFKAGLNLAAGIPGAEFVQLESDNHILTEDEPAWGELQQAIINFTGVQVAKENAVFEQLSVREREILAHMIEGETNPEIGRSLFISEKTVRNHVTHIFGKLGVSNRAQAMVLARDNGFRP